MSVINPNTGLPTEILAENWEAVALGKNLTEVNEDSDEACIMEKSFDDSHRYFIKVGERGQILNPWMINSGRESVNKSFGMKYWKWRKVAENTHSLYHKFLQTRNQLFLRDAERMMMING